MYKKHKIISCFLAVFLFVLSFFLQVRLNESVISSLITVFSIVFGFYMTSISVLYGTGYIKKLYKKTDPQKKEQTELHTLQEYFSKSCHWSLLSIFVLLIFLLIAHEDIHKELIWTEGIWSFNVLGRYSIAYNSINFWTSVVLAIVGTNFYFLILILHVSLKGFLEEAKKLPDKISHCH